jgi:hypothetical protein
VTPVRRQLSGVAERHHGQAVSNIVNQGGDPMSVSLFGNMIKALPTKYYKLLNRYRFYTSKTKEIDYRMSVAQRQTSLGDAIICRAISRSRFSVFPSLGGAHAVRSTRS